MNVCFLLVCLRSIVNSVGNNSSGTKAGKQLKVKAQIHTPTEESGISDPIGMRVNVCMVNIYCTGANVKN